MLQKFNSWGVARVKDNKVSVTLTAMRINGEPITLTTVTESKRGLDFTGSAMIAVDIMNQKRYVLAAHEVDQVQIMTHPEVVKVLEKTVNWIRQSAGL